MKCTNCVFLGTFQDMGASFQICLFQDDNKIRTPDNYPFPCPNKFTTDEARGIIIRSGKSYCCTDENKKPKEGFTIIDFTKMSMDKIFQDKNKKK